MSKFATTEDLIEHFRLLPEDLGMIKTRTDQSLLGFIMQLKIFQKDNRFPESLSDIPLGAVEYVAKQLNVQASSFQSYDFESRNAKYHRSHIRQALKFRQNTDKDSGEIMKWMVSKIFGQDTLPEALTELLYKRYRELKIEPPLPERVERLVRSALHEAEQQLYKKVSGSIKPETKKEMDRILSATTDEMTLTDIKSDPGRPGLESFLFEVRKLTYLRKINISEELFEGVSKKVINQLKSSVSTETIHETFQHPEYIRYTLMAAFCFTRSQQITDTLLDLLLHIIHKIGARSERKVEKELLKDLRKISGKAGILYQIAEASLNDPDGIVRDVVFPVVGEKTLKDLVREYKANGPAYQSKVYSVMRGSYRSHYRRMVPELLTIFDFRSNNGTHRPVIDGIDLLRKYKDKRNVYFDSSDKVPIKGVIRKDFLDLVVEKDEAGNDRINRINYELALLQALRERLRCKEIWVVGANRYRNPDDDLPNDFESNREKYYAALDLPLNKDVFISNLQFNMNKALKDLNDSSSSNLKVKFLSKKGGWISVSPLEPEPEPTNLIKLKTEIGSRWSMTSLLDILKEAALRTGFAKHFKGTGNREILTEETLHRRLLMCLFGLGTNTGIKRVSATIPGENYQDLLYIKRKFIDKESLRQAIIVIANATHRARMQNIWGTATTSVASDSKKFGSWDQNLMTEWHIRYGGRGVMIYWHVDKKSLCIYSQLKSCSSSEVAAMIEGLIKHCTEMKVEKNYVDSHGQSEVAFAICHLLGFKLMPRLAGIATQKLYRTRAGDIKSFPNLKPVLTRPIKWDLISEQYDEMVKYATALKIGTAETEAILKRFTRNNLKHPTYKAFGELGKVIKTIFLCQYLEDEDIRREINSGLNVVENWNSANGFIFFGKNSEVATNRLDEQEISVLALHLLQSSLVYINTLMLQRVLSEDAWFKKMGVEDFRGLSPLFYAHINPYGTFTLDMSDRLSLDAA